MKMYHKSNLKLRNGMLVALDGTIVIPDHKIIAQANDLETLYQQASYLAAQPSATPMPSLDGFKRESEMSKVVDDAKFEAITPVIDMKACESLALMDELDDVKTVQMANKLLEGFSDLLAFVSDDYVIDCGGNQVFKFDTPTLGSVLELTKKNVTDVIALASGLDEDEDENDDHNIMLMNMDQEDFEEILKSIKMHEKIAEEKRQESEDSAE